MTKCHPSDWLSVEVDLAPTAATSEIISRRLPHKLRAYGHCGKIARMFPGRLLLLPLNFQGNFP